MNKTFDNNNNFADNNKKDKNKLRQIFINY